VTAAVRARSPVTETGLRCRLARLGGAAPVLDGTRFTNQEAGLQDGTRYIIQSRVAYPISHPGWCITRERSCRRRITASDPEFHPTDQSSRA